MGFPPKEFLAAHSSQALGTTAGLNDAGDASSQNSTAALTMPGSTPVLAYGATVLLPQDVPHTSRASLLESHHPETGLARIAHSHCFVNFTLLVIVLNGLWIGFDVEWNHPSLKKNGVSPLESEAFIVENLFCGYFTFEIGLRVLAFGRKNFKVPLRFWFVFDFVLVAFMVTETWIMLIVDYFTGGGGGGFLSKFSTLRLLRLSRLTRLLTSLPELLVLIKGMLNATKAVAIVLGFMVMLMYVFAIVFTAQLGHSESPEKLEADPYWVRDTDPTAQELFGSLGDSMLSLFTRGMLCDNLAETLEAIKDRGGEYACADEDGNEVDSARIVGDGKVCERTGGELWLM